MVAASISVETFQGKPFRRWRASNVLFHIHIVLQSEHGEVGDNVIFERDVLTSPDGQMLQCLPA